MFKIQIFNFSGIVKSPLAGDFMTIECRKLMDELGVEVVPPYLIQSKVTWKKLNFIAFLTVANV